VTIVLDGMTGPAPAASLARVLATRDVWAWVDEDCASGRLRRGDSVLIREPSQRGRAASVSTRGSMLPVVDASGLAVVSDPDDAREALGFVRAVWRDRSPWPLDAQPWRSLLATGSTRRWRVAERLRSVTAPMTRTLLQLAKQPSLADVEESEAGFYDRADVVADYERLVDEGLTKAEEILAARFLDAGARVLVVGCGTGRESFALARRGMHVQGIDIAPAAIASAQRRGSVARAATEPREGATGSVSFTTASLAALDLSGPRFDLVLIASDVLCGIPGRANRVAALTRAREGVKHGGMVVMAARAGRGPARLLLETPRAVLRIVGLGHREPGDRLDWQGPPPTLRFVHVYADDVEIAKELELASLAYEGRLAGFVLARSGTRASLPGDGKIDAAVETASVLRMLLRVERARRKMGPAALAAMMRLLSDSAPHRTPLERARLRATIASCDRLVPFGAGCYRRALLEMALDAGAAEEPLVLGLRRHGIGHAWVGAMDTEESFDWVVRV
jgi:SAM-dependent methyltransferase